MNVNKDSYSSDDCIAVSRLLSKILRHEPEMVGLRLDNQGWVGARHGRPLVLVVDAARMHADGCAFCRSDNGVWLTELVPTAYLAQLGQHGHGSKS
jgi:RNA:NAD 2'-phosphotransferase (TPT1/KptA family)